MKKNETAPCCLFIRRRERSMISLDNYHISDASLQRDADFWYRLFDSIATDRQNLLIRHEECARIVYVRIAKRE